MTQPKRTLIAGIDVVNGTMHGQRQKFQIYVSLICSKPYVWFYAVGCGFAMLIMLQDLALSSFPWMNWVGVGSHYHKQMSPRRIMRCPPSDSGMYTLRFGHGGGHGGHGEGVGELGGTINKGDLCFVSQCVVTNQREVVFSIRLLESLSCPWGKDFAVP